jgi:SAM-dependent methyltransferase
VNPYSSLVPIAFLLLVVAIQGMRRRKRERAEDALADLFEQLQPPRDMHDPAAWDRYWDNHFANQQTAGLAVMMAEMFSSVRDVARVMKAAGSTSILCAGHGVSREAAALARAGFSVVALDLSPRAAEWCGRLVLDDASLRRFLDPEQEAPGGHVEYVVGDLTNPSVCGGPFDLIIERRTGQLFGEARDQALEALGARLAPRGVLLSHWHDGRWRPPSPRTHPNEQWFREHGWTILSGESAVGNREGRAAWLLFTTG